MTDHTSTPQSTQEIPYGYCQCGCGQKTLFYKVNNANRGYIKGQPQRFIRGHYARVQPVRPLEDRFWEKVDRRGPDDCWEWLGYTDSKGYGCFNVGDAIRRAHRVSWKIHFGTIPDGLLVCHHCDNPPCVNPAHLWIGTNDDNMADRTQKGRAADTRGTRNGRAKLTEADVRDMRFFYAAGFTLRQIADMYGMSKSATYSVVSFAHWQDVK